MSRKFITYLVAVLLLLLIALALRLMASPWSFHFFEHYSQEPTERIAQENGESTSLVWGDVPNWLQFLAAVPIALFSYWLFRLGKLQSLMLRRANRTAASALEEARKANEAATKANQETRRSVDLFANAERGVWYDLDPSYNATRTKVGFKALNIGRSPLVLRQFQYRYSTQPLENHFNYKIDRGEWQVARVVDRLVKVNETIAANVEQIECDIPEHLHGPAFWGAHSALEIQLVYTTLGIHYVHRAGWLFRGGKQPRPLFFSEFFEDRVLDDDHPVPRSFLL